jgi:hypothetical protein
LTCFNAIQGYDTVVEVYLDAESHVIDSHFDVDSHLEQGLLRDVPNGRICTGPAGKDLVECLKGFRQPTSIFRRRKLITIGIKLIPKRSKAQNRELLGHGSLRQR